MSSTTEMDTPAVVRPRDGILLGREEEQPMDGPLTRLALTCITLSGSQPPP